MSAVKFLITFLYLFNLSILAGVEFDSAEIPLSDELTAAYSEGLNELIVEKETGYNILKYFKKGGKFPYLVIAHSHGEQMRQEYDMNGDGFPEFIKKRVEGERYVFEELGNVNKKERAYHYRRRYYPIEGTRKARRVAEFRKSEKDSYKVLANQVVEFGSFATAKNQCLRVKIIPLGDSSLFEDVERVVNRFSLDWSPTMRRVGNVKFPAEIERACDDKLEGYLNNGEKFLDFYGETINTGLKCLRDLSRRADETAGVNLLFKNSIASLVGQHAYVVPRVASDMDPNNRGFPRIARNQGAKPITVICSQRNFQFGGENHEGGLGYASTGRSGKEITFNCSQGPIKVTHPFMTLNFDNLNANKSSSRETNRRMLQKVVFHEFLHTAGWDHNDFWDPVEKCAAHCFGLGTAEDKDYCMGSGNAAGFTEQSFEFVAERNYGLLRRDGYSSSAAFGIVRQQLLEAAVPQEMMPGAFKLK